MTTETEFQTIMSAVDVAQLTGILTGETKRAATKGAAVKRFATVAAEHGVSALDIVAILNRPYAIAVDALKASMVRKSIAAAKKAPAVEPKPAKVAKVAKAPAPAVPKTTVAAKPTETDEAATTSSRSRFDGSRIIRTVGENKKTKGSQAHQRFELYKAGQTASEFVAACVKAGFTEQAARADLSWDRRHNLIEIE